MSDPTTGRDTADSPAPATVETAELVTVPIAEPGAAGVPGHEADDQLDHEPGHTAGEARHNAAEPLDEELPTLDPSATAAGAEPQTVAGMTRIVCPQCSTVWQGNDLRPHAAWFCTQCQFPLFWVNAGIRSSASSIDDSLVRLPGTNGRTTLSSIICPTCGEHNLPVPTANCWRCHNPLTPLDPPPPPPPAPPVVIAPPVIVPARRRIWPWVLATGLLSLTLLVIVLILIFND